MSPFVQRLKASPRFRPSPNQLDLFGGPSTQSDDVPSEAHTEAPPPLALHDSQPRRVAIIREPEILAAKDDGEGFAPDRGPPVDLDPEPELPPSSDFRIAEAHRIGQGSIHHKALDNIAAIRVLKAVEKEDRQATDPEREMLARYAGWGAMPNAFHWNPPEDWKFIARAAKETLTPEEYDSARASTPNAHFTSPMVISAMWQAMARIGLQLGGQVLEPAMGIGHFFGLMPDDLATGAKRTGVELDSISARISQKLYPDSTVFHKGFEETNLPDNFFDTVIGNVPFGDYGVHDPAYKRTLTRAIHDYFFAKSLDKLRLGGVMALITSRYTMDKQDETIRQYLADRADLVGAIRLPNTAFKANAGTEVTTDILFLQKRISGAQLGTAWLSLAAIETPDGPTRINEYFANNPHMMLGQMRLECSMYRTQEPTLEGELTPEILARALENLPAGLISHGERRPAPASLSAIETGVKDGAYTDIDGALFIRNGASLDPVALTASAAARVRGMIQIRDAVREVFRTQLDDAPEHAITLARSELNRVYDNFTKKHGAVNGRENVRAFSGDPDQPLLLSLEQYDPESKTASKTSIFARRTLERYKPVEKVETAAEALTVSLNETGAIHWPRMQELTGRTEKQLQRELGSLVYKNPEGGWETADRYLSGNVRAKLKSAEVAAELDPGYERNVGALTAVQPADLQPGEIEGRLGAPWIPASDVRDFTAELLSVRPDQVRVFHSAAIASWTLDMDYYVKHDVANTTTHGTARALATSLIEDALNGRTPTIYDQIDKDTRVVNQQETLAAREKQQQLKDAFREWVWKDPARAERLARVYNDRYNNIRLREFDGSHLTLPGMNREYLRTGDLDKHQKNVVWRIMQTPTTLLAHAVGAGKSISMSTAAMELRRVGIARKPMIVVPNHLVEQMGTEFLKVYPTANLFIAGKDQFTTGNRQKAMGRIATGNYDAVIVSHKSFELLPVSDETFKRFIDQQIDQLEDAIREAKAEKGDNRRIVKEIERSKKRLNAKLKERADRERKDLTITFEELGVDQIFVDESDAYKNLGVLTKMNRIAGLPNTESNRAIDMFIKSRYIRERHGRGIVFATGTPISNTMAEMFTMQRYLAPEDLEARGLAHFDAWAASFGEAVTALELAPDGSGYRMHTRFAKFINLPELLTMFRSSADVQTADMLNLPRPVLSGGKPQAVAAPASEDLKAFVQTLVKRSEDIRGKSVDPRKDNMLKITGEGRKAALDMRLVDPSSEPDTEAKIAKAVNRIFETWERTHAGKSTQLVFCDLSTPSTDKFNVYDEVKSHLTTRGVPTSEVAFIHDADTDAAKKTLFDAVNSGRVRILLGSTEKMGAGTNVQKRLIALHHLDAPWRPRDIEQREGRILRQGNTNPEVHIFRYVTEGSFDAYMWQTLETKARFIQQVMNGSVTVRQAEDLEGGALTYAEIKAIASGNPAVMEKVKVDTEVRKLDQLRSAHMNQQHSIRWQIRSLPEQIERAQASLEKCNADIATRDQNFQDELSMTVGKRAFSGKGAREEAAKALTKAVMDWRDDPNMVQRASWRGFVIVSRGRGSWKLDGHDERLPDLFIKGAGLYSAKVNPENPLGTMQSLEATLRSLERFASNDEEHVAKLSKQLTDYQGQANKPFEHEARLKELIGRQSQLNAALDLDKGERQVAEEDEPESELPHGFVEREANRRADATRELQ